MINPGKDHWLIMTPNVKKNNGDGDPVKCCALCSDAVLRPSCRDPSESWVTPPPHPPPPSQGPPFVY